MSCPWLQGAGGLVEDGPWCGPEMQKAMHAAENEQHMWSSVDMPERVDWREQGVITAVNNQGGCNGCYAFSVVETVPDPFLAVICPPVLSALLCHLQVESRLAIATKNLTRLSVQACRLLIDTNSWCMQRKHGFTWQQAISCDKNNSYGCESGYTECVYQYLMQPEVRSTDFVTNSSYGAVLGCTGERIGACIRFPIHLCWISKETQKDTKVQVCNVRCRCSSQGLEARPCSHLPPLHASQLGSAHWLH